jgi:molecular chaperone GrpE
MSGQAHHPEDPANEDSAAPEPEKQGVEADGDAPEVLTEEAAIQELQAKAAENWDRYVRATAELENFRKRASRDVEKARKFAIESFSRDLLAVRDSLELGLQAAESADVDSIMAGSEATLKLLTTTMARFGVEEVDPEGEPFDPEFHEAMTMQPSADAEPGSVLSVAQKGYTLNSRLLRPAMVVVAAEPAAETDEE